MEKTCTKCGITKPLDQYGKKKDNKDGLYNSCKVCEGKRKAKYAYTPEEWSNWRRKKKFGMSPEQYKQLLETQNNKCAICKIPLEEYIGIHGNGKKVDSFTVDHCHTTGEIRGLTCFYCNLMLGYAQDNPATLEAGAKYLKEKARHSGLFVSLVNSN